MMNSRPRSLSRQWGRLGTVAGLGLCAALGVSGAGAVAVAVADPGPPAAPRAPLPGAWQPFPTRATAGARLCTHGSVVSLGPARGSQPLVGFGRSGGLVVWMQDETTLAVQALAVGSGSALGKPVSLQVEATQEPHAIYAIEHGFVLLLRRWDWKNSDVKWWGVLVGPDARGIKPPVDLGLADLDVVAGQSMAGDRVGLLVGPAYIARKKLPGRWQALSLGPEGALRSTATAVAVDDLITAAQGRFEPAQLDGAVGWVLLGDDKRLPDGVFDGARRPAAAATLLRGSEVLSAEVTNLATPPPGGGRGPGGRITEMAPIPALARTHAGKPLGPPTELEVAGHPVGGAGLSVRTHFAWTGTRFLYPFVHEFHPVSSYDTIRTASLLPIDCAPGRTGSGGGSAQEARGGSAD